MKPFSFGQLNPTVVFILFLIVGFFAYGQTLFYPFVHDDLVFIVNNPNISNLNIIEVFHPREVGQASADIINVYYRPFIELFHRLQFKVFGLNPFGFHLTMFLFTS